MTTSPHPSSSLLQLSDTQKGHSVLQHNYMSLMPGPMTSIISVITLGVFFLAKCGSRTKGLLLL